MHISPKIKRTLGLWLGYKPPEYTPIYNDVDTLLKELDDRFQEVVYKSKQPPVCQTVKELHESIDEFNYEVAQMVHQKR